jgi:hypothetical protein
VLFAVREIDKHSSSGSIAEESKEVVGWAGLLGKPQEVRGLAHATPLSSRPGM